MSSAGETTISMMYFCHRCEATVRIVPPIGADPVCPICGDSFLEELEAPISSSTSGVELRSSGDFAGLLGFESPTAHPQPRENQGFDAQLFFHDHIRPIYSGGGSIQVMFDGAGSLTESIGEYVFGPGIENVMHQLFENDPNRRGSPPAAKSAVEALPVIEVSEEMAAGEEDEARCAVCWDAFEAGDEATEMPCKHVYHRDCIVPWLALHCSCPVCRRELPTDDPEWVPRVSPSGSGGRSGGAWNFEGMRAAVMGGERRPAARRRGRRRSVRISLPWPLSGGGVDENFEGRESSGPEDSD